MRTRTRTWCMAGVLASAAACGNGGSGAVSGKHSQGHAEVGGQVISTVHGFPITVADVQALVDASDLTPRDALRRLQQERLLMAAAEERGFGRDSEVGWVQRQAAVQTLLDNVANTVTVSDGELRAAYDGSGQRFGYPELRVSVHVLARLPKKASPQAEAAAKAFAAQMIEGLGQASDPTAFAAGLNGQKRPEFEVVGETLPPVPNGGMLEAPFMSALYAAKEPGIVAAPVRTSYGWHAVRVVQIIPENRTPLEEAAKQLRPELLVARRTKVVDELIERIRKQHGAQRPENVTELLGKLPP
jgi:hypothetical protein